MFSEPITTAKLSELLDAELAGSGDIELTAIAAIDQAGDGDVTFASDEKRLAEVSASNAAAVILPRSVDVQSDKVLLKVDNVDAAIATLLAHVAPREDSPTGVAASAVIAEDAEIAADVCIGEHVVIGSGAKIGKGCVLFHGVKIGANVTIGEDCILCEGAVVRFGCELGSRVRIGPNSVVGYDGYGYHFANGVHNKIIHAGNVVIEDDVELGACCCIDRAKWGSTLIGAGTKVDNLVQVAHNVQVGRGVLLVAQVGVAGSARLGNYVVIGGGSGVRDNISIGDGTMLAAHSAIAQSAGPGETLAGTPAKDAKKLFRELLAMNKLPDLLKKVKKLEKAVESLSRDN